MQDVSPSLPHRVAFVSGGLNLGGATTFLVNLAGELIRRGGISESLQFRVGKSAVG